MPLGLLTSLLFSGLLESFLHVKLELDNEHLNLYLNLHLFVIFLHGCHRKYVCSLWNNEFQETCRIQCVTKLLSHFIYTDDVFLKLCLFERTSFFMYWECSNVYHWYNQQLSQYLHKIHSPVRLQKEVTCSVPLWTF